MEHAVIRKLVREHLYKILEDFNKPETVTQTEPSVDDSIFYNFERGRQFAFNKLQNKIINLEKYNLAEYFPINEEAERWMFETGTAYGKTLLVEIRHKISNSKSIWYFIYSTMNRDEQFPQIEFSSGPVLNYKSFIDKINSTSAKLIDPEIA